MNGKNRSAEDSAAWGQPSVLDFFGHNRKTFAEVYASERFFLEERLSSGQSVLDVGCAQGGFADILAERLDAFSYTGLDVNQEMVRLAQVRHPNHVFHCIAEADYSVLGNAAYDLVLVLGILHLHDAWRETLRGAWARTRGSLIFDLRQIGGATVEDREISYMKMDFDGDDASGTARIPYILVNSGEAQSLIESICFDARSIAQYGYRHPVTPLAVTQACPVMAMTWCIER